MACKEPCQEMRDLKNAIPPVTKDYDKLKAATDAAFEMFTHSGLAFDTSLLKVKKLARALGEAGYPGFATVDE